MNSKVMVLFEQHHKKTCLRDFGPHPTQKPQKLIRGVKFRIKKEVGMYYPSSENKGTDQFPGYQEADLYLCFCICKRLVFF